MLTPIATIVCAAAMALSLSVEAGSFFRPSESPAITEGSGDAQSPEPSASSTQPTHADATSDTVRPVERDGVLVPSTE